MTTSPATDLVARSNRLGADPRNTNYAGGNTSAKGAVTDPVTQQPIELMWVKGSGGDLGTLTESGLAVLRLDRLYSLVEAYPGADREDEMVSAFDYCLHGKGGAAPSIDTAMHGLVETPHVDHLHPDSGIALATAKDGEALTKECFGDRVVWVPWRRPGFQLGLDISAIKDSNPSAIGCILGGHGITAWAETSEQCEANSLEIIRTAEAFLVEHGKPEPFGAVVPGFDALPVAERHARAAILAPVIHGLASTDHPQVGHYTDSEVVLEFCSRDKLAPLAAMGTSCPDHFLRTKVRPLVVDLPTTASFEQIVSRLRELHTAYRADYAAYYERHATPDSPPMRGADPAIVLVPGVGLFSFGTDKQTARVASEFYTNAINVMRGAEAVSAYTPIDEAEKFRIEYWALQEAKLARRPKPKPLATRIALVTGAGSGIGRAIAQRLSAEGACVVIADLDSGHAQSVAEGISNSDKAIAVTANVTDATGGAGCLRRRSAGLRRGGLRGEQRRAVHLQAAAGYHRTGLGPPARRRGQGIVPGLPRRGQDDDRPGPGRGHHLLSSKNAVFAGPNNVAYGAAKADQDHQVRLLATELGGHGIRVNGINPDGVVRDSGIFAGGWGAKRAAVYGVPEEELGAYYAGRTLLKREVRPEHVAAAVFALTTGDLSMTTGLHIPVDSGLAAAFLR